MSLEIGLSLVSTVQREHFGTGPFRFNCRMFCERRGKKEAIETLKKEAAVKNEREGATTQAVGVRHHCRG